MLKIIFEQSFSSKEKRWGLPSDYKSENSESVCTLFALQNGKFADFKIYDEGKRLHVQINLKDAYSTVPLDKSCRHLVRFLWEGNIYEFQCLCFGLGPAPQVFTKVLKVPISLLLRLNTRIMIYLDMLLMSQSIERLLVARDTAIFLDIWDL